MRRHFNHSARQISQGLCGAALLFCLPARAADDPGALFHEGRRAMKEGDCASAIPLFQRSQALDPAVGTALNLAICEERAAQLVRASGHFQYVVEHSPSGDHRRTYAEARLKALQSRLARLTVQVRGELPTNVELLIDARPVARAELGTDISLDPGLHEVRLEDSGKVVLSERIELRDGEHRVWAPPPALLALKDPADASERETRQRARRARSSSASSDTSERGSSASRTFGYVLGGAGVASLTTSLVLGTLVLQKKQQTDRHCDEDGCDSEGLKASDSGKELSRWATISGIAAIPALAIGGYLVISYDPGSKSAPHVSAGLGRAPPLH